MQKLLTYDDLAELLGLSPGTVKVWGSTAPDKLPPRMNIGRRVRFHPDTVANWMKAKDAKGQKYFGDKV
jgi:predicted DNA-binding transcriptional regulator AlpA